MSDFPAEDCHLWPIFNSHCGIGVIPGSKPFGSFGAPESAHAGIVMATFLESITL